MRGRLQTASFARRPPLMAAVHALPLSPAARISRRAMVGKRGALRGVPSPVRSWTQPARVVGAGVVDGEPRPRIPAGEMPWKLAEVEPLVPGEKPGAGVGPAAMFAENPPYMRALPLGSTTTMSKLSVAEPGMEMEAGVTPGVCRPRGSVR